MVIGITGGSGSGKSYISKLFGIMGAYVINADKIGHNVLEVGGSAYSEVVSIFGTDILNNDKTINRKKLANIVFSNKAELSKLNLATHKHIVAQIKELIAKSHNKVIILDAALLNEPVFAKLCDIIVFVKADKTERINRITVRDRITQEQALMRINMQVSDEEYEKSADICILNDENVSKTVNELYIKWSSIVENS